MQIETVRSFGIRRNENIAVHCTVRGAKAEEKGHPGRILDLMGKKVANVENLLGDELASKLSEPKTDLMVGVIEMFGVEIGVELFRKTQDIESKGIS